MARRVDTANLRIDATPDALYAAFVDPEGLVQWLPPEGMTARVLEFDPRPGGAYRMVLTYDDPDTVAGKTTEDSDAVAGRFVELVPGKRIVQLAEFEAEEAEFSGTMRITWSFTPAAEGGSWATVRCEDVPQGISKAEHDAGLRSSLSNLAAFVTGVSRSG